MRTVTRPFWILVALVFLFEAWLWEHLRPIVAWIVDLVSWATLRARIAAALIDPIKNEVRAWWRRELRPVRRRVRRIILLMRPAHSGRLLQRVTRIRRRMHAAVPAPSKPAA